MKVRATRGAAFFVRLSVILAGTIIAVPLIGQQVPDARDAQEAAQRAQQVEKLQRVLNDKTSYAAAIVSRWEQSARATGRWDEHYTVDLTIALLRLQPENLLAAGEAESYQEMMEVLATGRRSQASVATPQPQAGEIKVLGSAVSDLVYTPVTPCRIVDTRYATAGAVIGGSTRTFDADGANLAFQGGSSTGCGIPYGVSTAVAMNITVTSPVGIGYFTAWGLGTQPTASVINYTAGATLANSTIVPIVPGVGNDFSLYSMASAHAVIDVLGYFAAPEATALDCTTVASAEVLAAVNVWTAIDATCPTGRTATGGGYNTGEGTLGYPNVWVTSLPVGNGWRTWVDNQATTARRITTYVRCCRIPGR